MKLVKNNCFGGFSLSAKATAEYYKLKGKKAYFFKLSIKDKYQPITQAEADKMGLFWTEYSVPNPQDYRLSEIGKDGTYKEANARANEISLEINDRTDKDLVKVVEKLGKKANGRCADLVIVDIPDGVEYEIDNYDGLETVREAHRAW